MVNISVYLVSGMLDSGKTTFIKNSLQSFEQMGGRTLLLVCESGDEEYTGPYQHVDIREIASEADFSPESLAAFTDGKEYDQILIEYNGMWDSLSVRSKLPDNWLLQQSVCTVDATSFFMYLKNMPQIMVDKLRMADMSIWNRCTPELAEALRRQNLRIINRKAALWLQYTDGRVEDYRDGLTNAFDMSADLINIPNDDYGIWYAEVMDAPAQYVGKRVRMQVMVGDGYRGPYGVVGRIIMTCCEKDMEFLTVACDFGGLEPPLPGDYLELEGIMRQEQLEVHEEPAPVIQVNAYSKIQYSGII